MRIAMSQYPITQHTSIEDWNGHVRQWVDEAVSNSAQVLVFPEYGSMELVSFMSEDVQKSLRLQILEMQKCLPIFQHTFSKLAQEKKVAILAPSFPVVDAKFSKPVNRAFFFFPDGTVGTQDKIHMTRFEDESWGVGAGSKDQNVFEVFGIKFGISICFDVEFPFPAFELSQKGAQVLLAPSCTESLRGLNRVHVGARARALENQFFVIVSQTVGSASWSEAVDLNNGQAACYSTCDVGFPEDGTLAKGALNIPGWTYVDLDLGLIDKVREGGQVFNFKNMKTYARPK